MTIKQLAENFSGGKFEETYPYLSEDMEWYIFGERTLQGKDAVIAYCTKVSGYFNSVTTDFKMHLMIADINKIAINGIAKFIRDGVIVAVIDACDVYDFNESGKIQKIYSYCINEKPAPAKVNETL